MARTSFDREPGSKATVGAAGVEPQSRQQLAARRRLGNQLHERVPDELDGDADPLVDLRLEREDDQHAIDEPLHRRQAAGAPRPQLRADVVDDGDAQPVHGLAEAEVEVREVDQHQDVRPPLAGRRDEPSIHRVRARQLLRHLDDAGDAQPAVVADQFCPGTRRVVRRRSRRPPSRAPRSRSREPRRRRRGRRTPRRTTPSPSTWRGA